MKKIILQATVRQIVNEAESAARPSMSIHHSQMARHGGNGRSALAAGKIIPVIFHANIRPGMRNEMGLSVCFNIK